MFIREVFLLGYEYQKLINQYFDLSFFYFQALLVEFIIYFYRFKRSAPKKFGVHLLSFGLSGKVMKTALSVMVSVLLFASTTYADTIPTQSSEVDLTPLEEDSNHTSYFFLEISKPLSVDVSVDYKTRDSTANAGEDYSSTNGIATIIAGQTNTVIGVEIIGDTLPESDEIFHLVISNPVGANFPAGVTEIIASKTIIDDDNETKVFQLDAWADNWFAAYLDESLIVEDSVPITTERSFNKETAIFTGSYPLNINVILKDFKENDTGLEYIGAGNQQMGDGGFILKKSVKS